MSQYWEVWFADRTVVTSDECAPHELPNKRAVVVLQPGTYERTGWQPRLYNGNHLFFRTDLDCWTEHDEASWAALEEMKDHAHVISCYRQGKFTGEFKAIRREADAHYEEDLIGG